MLNAPPVGRRPGSGGIDYGGGITYKNPKGEVVSSNERTLDELRQAAASNPFNQPATNELPVQAFAKGGLASDGFVVPADVVSHLGNGSSEAGLKLLASKFGAEPIKGDGDGMSDSIPTKIDGVQQARVANEEAFISPEMVERLGNGDSRKGAKKLYAMMDQIRKDRTGTSKQGKQIEPEKYMPGGSVNRYEVGGTTTRAVPAGSTGSESSLSNWAGDYVTDMLGRGSALAQAPYEAYTGPLTAGASNLQQQAFTQAGNLTSPTSVGDAASTVGGIASGLAQAPAYAATQFGNTFQAPAAYTPSGAPSYQQASAGNVTSGFQAPDAYTPTVGPTYNDLTAQNVASSFQAPAAYQTGTFENQFRAPTQSSTTQFTNQYLAPAAYQAGQFDGGVFSAEQASQYMNPYLQASLEPQLAEARRQADISRLTDAGRLTQAGAFGGSRQAIMESEGRRNLGTKLADITGQGYNTAYTNAMSQFNADQNRSLTAQQAQEASRQFGATQGMNAAQMQAQYGLSAQQAQEMARQFNQGQAMTAAQLQAQFGLSAQQAQEASRQFGAQQALAAATTAGQQGLQAGIANQQAGLTAGQANLNAAMEAARQREQSRQFGSSQALTSATTAGQLGLQAGIANQQAGLTASQQNINAALDAARQQEQSRQFGSSQGLTSAQLQAQYGLAGQQAQEQSKQFGANLGLQTQQAGIQAALAQGNLGNMGFQNDLAGINALSALGGTQRAIESEGIAADKKQFEEARLNPFQMLQFEQSLLSGMPLASQSYTTPGQSNFQQFAQGTLTAQQILDILNGTTPAAPVR
jgi:hypothetical protein